MPRFLKSSYGFVKQAASEWMSQNVSRYGAALAFYTLFAIAPLGSRLEPTPGAKAVTLAEVVAETPHPVG